MTGKEVSALLLEVVEELDRRAMERDASRSYHDESGNREVATQFAMMTTEVLEIRRFVLERIGLLAVGSRKRGRKKREEEGA